MNDTFLSLNQVKRIIEDLNIVFADTDKIFEDEKYRNPNLTHKHGVKNYKHALRKNLNLYFRRNINLNEK